jgi:hypothetical protein
MIWAWCVKESEPRRWVQEARSGSKPDSDGRSGPGAKRTFDKAVKRLWANRHLDLTLIQTLPTLKASHALPGSTKTPIGLAANSREEGCFPP